MLTFNYECEPECNPGGDFIPSTGKSHKRPAAEPYIERTYLK